MKPMLASNYDESKLKFPLGAQVKIDGVRGLTTEGKLTGRSLKAFKNKYTNQFFNQPEYMRLDGEFAAEDERHPALCRLTTSALNSIEGQPFLLWHVFDYLTENTVKRKYIDRYAMMVDYVFEMQSKGLCGHLRVVPMQVCHDLEQLLVADARNLDQGYEGTIIRDLGGLHKEGRSTVREGGLLRIKRFTEEEAVVLEIVEGRVNKNEEQTNELGRTFRTSHQENQVPNGQVGSLICTDIKTQKRITVSAGAMPHSLRIHYFNNPALLLGQTIKYKFFPHGEKDLPRFPTFQSLRAEEDMSND